MNYLQALRRLCGEDISFVECPSQRDWLDIESELGRALPTDFRDLIGMFGSGSFGGDFVLKNPIAGFARDRLAHGDLVEYGEMISSGLENQARCFYPAPEGLVSISSSGTASDLYYKPTKSDWQLVWFDSDFDQVIEVPYPITEYSFRSYNGTDSSTLVKKSRIIWGKSVHSRPFFLPKIRRS